MGIILEKRRTENQNLGKFPSRKKMHLGGFKGQQGLEKRPYWKRKRAGKSRRKYPRSGGVVFRGVSKIICQSREGGMGKSSATTGPHRIGRRKKKRHRARKARMVSWGLEKLRKQKHSLKLSGQWTMALDKGLFINPKQKE